MGRMLTFMSRIMADEGVSVARGVGVDEHTALLLDVATGDVTTVGVNTAYVCTPQHVAEVCKEDIPLTFRGSINKLCSMWSKSVCYTYIRYFVDVNCVRLSGKSGDTFSFKTFHTGDGGVKYVNDIVGGHYANFPYGPGMEN